MAYSSQSLLTTRQFFDSDLQEVAYDGSPVTWRVSAYVIVIKDGQLLLGKSRHETLYDFLGGGIDIGESIEEGLQREAMEEGGAVVKIGELVHTYCDWFYHKREKKFYQTLQLFYLAELEGELTDATDPDIEWSGFVPLAEVGAKYRLPLICEELLPRLIQQQ